MKKSAPAKNTVKSAKQRHIGYYIPIIIIIAVIPLIMRGKIVELSQAQADFWKGGSTHVDFFCYYKSLFFVITSIAAFLAYLGLAMNSRLALRKEAKYYVPLAIYAIMTVVSTILSPHVDVAMQGFIEMYQGMPVLLCYVLVTFIVCNYMRDERDIKIFTYAYAAVTAVVGVLGITQYFGFDFFKTPVGNWLIAPEIIRNMGVKFNFGANTIYATMYNTNFVGSFAALVLPVSLTMYLFDDDRKKTVLFGAVTILAFITWLGCNSRAGYIGVAVSFIIGAVLFRKVILRKYKKAIVMAVVFAATVIVMNAASGGRVSNQFTRLNPVKEVERMESVVSSQTVKFEEVSLQENQATIRTTNETLYIKLEDSVLRFYDENGKKLGIVTAEDGIMTFEDERYAGYSIRILEDDSMIKVKAYGRNLDLAMMPDMSLKTVSMNGKHTEPVEAPRLSLFDGRETFASNRGYIWSRSVPMLRDTLIVGYGPDNFVMEFPQEDYVGRFNTGSGMVDIVVDKPHNMYLQIGINTGCISLVALVIMWIIYFVDSMKLYGRGNLENLVQYAGAACLLGVIGYLGAAMFNDSVISVAPLFWVLLGMGMGINHLTKNKVSDKM